MPGLSHEFKARHPELSIVPSKTPPTGGVIVYASVTGDLLHCSDPAQKLILLTRGAQPGLFAYIARVLPAGTGALCHCQLESRRVITHAVSMPADSEVSADRQSAAGSVKRAITERIRLERHPAHRQKYERSDCWGRSSAGRALRSQCRGQGFDPPRLHQCLFHHLPR